MKEIEGDNRRFTPGIRSKLMAIVLGATLILTLFIMLYNHTVLRARLDEQLDEKGVSLAQNMAARSVEPSLTNNIFELYELAYNTKENNEDVIYVLLEDVEGNIVVHTFQDYFPPDLKDVEHTMGDEEMNGKGEEVSLQKYSTEKGILRDIAVPVFEGPEPEKRVRLGIVDYSVQTALAATTRQLLLIALFSFLVAGSGVFLISNRIFIKPINNLLNSVKAVSEGDLSQQVKVRTGDELSELAENFNSMTETLARTKEMRDSLLQKIINTQEEERQRVARELHDETGPTLSTLMISLQFLEDAEDRDEFKQKLEEYRELLRYSLEQIRRLVWKLTPTLLVDMGLKAALESFIDKYWQDQGWEVNLVINGLEDRRLPSEIEVTVYRVIQEALTNISKHAKASKVDINVEATDEGINALIEDDGVGFEPAKLDPSSKMSLGLTSMQERVELVGGTFHLSSSPQQGTAVKINIPLPEEGVS